MTVYLTDFTVSDGLRLLAAMLVAGIGMGMVARLIR